MSLFNLFIYLFFVSFHRTFKLGPVLLPVPFRNYQEDKKCGNLNNNGRMERGNFGTFYPLINPGASAQKLWIQWISETLIGIHQNFHHRPQELHRRPQSMGQHVFLNCQGISARSLLTNLISLVPTSLPSSLVPTIRRLRKPIKLGYFKFQ